MEIATVNPNRDGSIQEVNFAVGLLIPGAFFERSPKGILYLKQPKCKYYPKVRWRLRSAVGPYCLHGKCQ